MNHQYWLSRWAENRIGFHLDDVNPLLKRFLPKFRTVPGRVLVPLCGKSLDLAWLAAEGYDVVGVDLSEIAARSFVSEQGIDAVSTDEPPFKVWRGENVTLFIGDFFDLTPEKSGLFDLVYDRAALIALPRDVRPLYARRLRSLLTTEGSILLISLEYDSAKMEGPPYTVPESEMRQIFSGWSIDKLHEVDCIEDEPRFKERGLTWMKEIVYRIVPS